MERKKELRKKSRKIKSIIATTLEEVFPEFVAEPNAASEVNNESWISEKILIKPDLTSAKEISKSCARLSRSWMVKPQIKSLDGQSGSNHSISKANRK